MSCGHQRCARHPARLFPAWIAIGLCLLTRFPANAADPTLLDLQRELKALFPRLPTSTSTLSLLTSTPTSPYAILEQEFLLALAPDLEATSTRLSLRQIRESPAAIKSAHTACVKIITPYWQGAGVLISPDGDILTSHHLVAGIPCASVQTLDGRIHTVTNITASSPIHDLALIHINGGPFPFISLNTIPDAPPGTPLHVVGHPGGTPWKLSHGTVVRHCPDRGTRLLHFEADIARGNSGGPIVDDAGHLLAITAFSAKLADGSSVKVGIAAPAIQAFLAEPRQPKDFANLARLERNRRLAEFLSRIYLMMDQWIAEWQESMAQVTLEETGKQNSATPPGTRFANTRKATEVSARLFLLKALLFRCGLLQDVDPTLTASIKDSAATLDTLMDGALLVGRQTGASPRETAAMITQLRLCRQEAEQRFDRALTGVQAASTQYELDLSNPDQARQFADMRSRNKSPGCRVER